MDIFGIKTTGSPLRLHNNHLIHNIRSRGSAPLRSELLPNSPFLVFHSRTGKELQPRLSNSRNSLKFPKSNRANYTSSLQMIIKGVFRRDKRWNPVRPIYGSFWGVGIGIGCGVGWGPGFGPEVVGYVGSGCGAGFSIGITLAGFGIGLPANSFFTPPSSGVSESSGLHSISELQQKIGRAFCSIMAKDSVKNAIDLSCLKNRGLLPTKRFLDGWKE